MAEKHAKSVIEKYADGVTYNHLSVISKKSEVVDKKNSESKVFKVKTSALFEFDTAEASFKIYEKIRIGIKDEPCGKIRLFFHNEENNSYISLITQGLRKAEDQTEKQFEEELIQTLRTINPNVVQVNIYPVAYNGSYIGRVYLKSEEEGKHFIAEYGEHREKLFKFYKERGSTIIFNISIDIKTLKKIKMA